METTLGTQNTGAILLGAPPPIMSQATGVKLNLHPLRAPDSGSGTAGRLNPEFAIEQQSNQDTKVGEKNLESGMEDIRLHRPGESMNDTEIHSSSLLGCLVVNPTAVFRLKMLPWLLLAAVLSAGCASRHYDVQLTDGSVFRSATKPKLTKEGVYLVRNDAGQSGSIYTNLVQQIVPVSDSKSKADPNSTKTKVPSGSAKPSGKANFRNSFEFR